MISPHIKYIMSINSIWEVSKKPNLRDWIFSRRAHDFGATNWQNSTSNNSPLNPSNSFLVWLGWLRRTMFMLWIVLALGNVQRCHIFYLYGGSESRANYFSLTFTSPTPYLKTGWLTWCGECTWIPRTQVAEEGGLQLWGRSGLRSDILSERNPPLHKRWLFLSLEI